MLTINASSQLSVQVSEYCSVVCKQLCLNMEQVQVESIPAVRLVFLVMLGVTRMRKYFPQSAAAFYRREKLHKVNREQTLASS